MSLKREADGANGSDLKKRKVLDKLSEDGPLTQKDVVYFQKEAIFRQLQKHKKQVEVVQGEYNVLQAEYNGCKDRFILLTQWVDQFLEYVAGLVPGDGSSELEFFLSAPSSIVDIDILKTLNIKKDQFSKVAAKFDGNASEDVKNAVATINKEFHNVTAKYDSLKADNEVLTKKYTKLSEELKELSNEHERLQSKTLGRVMKGKEEEHKTENREETKSDITAKIESSSNNAGIEDAKVEELQALISQQKAMIDAQETTIKENIERFGKLSTTIRTQCNSDEVINNSEKYQVLLKQKDDLQAKQVELVQRLEILENEVRESKDQAAHHKQSLDEFNSEKVKLEAQLNETKEKEERLRNQRDLYLTEIDVLKQKSNWKILNDLQDLVKAQAKQISTYNFEAKLAEAIPSEVSDVEQLQKKNALLSKEIGELEAAFQQLQSVRVPKILNAVDEEKRRKDLDVAKIKVDSKYRMLMEGEKYQQVTREKLETSFKVLKTSFEKLEASQVEYKNQIDTLNSELAELRKLSSKKELELKEYHKKCVKLEDGMKIETTQKKKAQHDFDTLKAEYQSLLFSESSKASEVSQLKFKLASQDKLIMRFKQTGSTEDSSELDSFRSLIYCSLCSKNWKNTAIKTCGHVFCESCAKERLAARMRKCPSCNKQFSSNDLLTIHL
jgi:E3 ubiquitin-protein ligase BRE1